MINEELKNKMETLFPALANVGNNSLGSSAELWQGVADKSADTIKGIIAPVKDFILDVQPDLQMRNDACPVVQVEVINSLGGPLINGENWDISMIQNKYVDVKLNRVSRPFMLTAYDLMRGERVESKVKAAMKEVALGVVSLFFDALDGSQPHTNLTSFSPEVCATISGAFGDKAETDTLLLSPTNYAKIVPTSALSLNPDVEGAYGIRKIYKTAGFTTDRVHAVALTRDGVAGAVATPEIVFNHEGQGMQYLGEVAGIPMVLISTWDYGKQAIKCSVETMAGFTVTDNSKVMTYSITE